MATPSLKWDASDVALKVTTASGGVVTMSFPDRATDVSFNMPLTALTNPMTTAGDVIVATTDGVPARVAIGTNGQVLQSNGTTAIWATLSYLTNPMTTDGDLIVGGASGVPTRLAKGTDTQVLTMVSGGIAWADATGGTGGFENPMTTAGDLILGGTDGAAGRLAIGTTGKVLTSNGTTATWEDPATGFSNPMTTLGDIITADTGGTAKRLGVGSEGQVLKVVSGEPSWSSPSSTKTYYDIDPLYTHTWTKLTDNYTTGCRFFVTSTASCTGARLYVESGKEIKVNLYDSSGTVLATKTFTSDVTGIKEITFDSAVSLSQYTSYEISHRCTSGDSRYYSNNTGMMTTVPFVCSPELVIYAHYYATGDARPTTLIAAARYPCFPKF